MDKKVGPCYNTTHEILLKYFSGLIIYFSYGCRHSINKEDTYLLSEPTSTEYYGTDQTSDKIPKIISSYKGKELENELPAQDQGKKVEPHSKDKDVS